MYYKLKTRQICLFFIAFLPIIKIFTLPSTLAGQANEDMWISSVFSFALDIGTLFAVLWACKHTQSNFYTLLENAVGKTGAKIIMALYFFMFMLKAVLPINEQKDYVEYTLYTLIPTTYYFLPFFIFAFYLCTKKLRVLGRAGDIMWLITLLGFILLFLLSVNNADFTSILPIGANGLSNILTGTYKSLPWFGDCVYMIFFIGEFAYNKRDTIKIVLSYALGAVLVIGFMIIFYSIFTSIAYRQRFAFTEISKYTTVINNTGRFDFIGILMLLLSNMFSLSLPLYFGCQILNYIFSIRKKWIAPLIVVGIQLCVYLFLSEFFVSIENFIVNYCGVLFFILCNVFPVLSVFLVKKEKNYADTQS